MKNRRGGLGRGLGALIPTGPIPAENAGGGAAVPEGGAGAPGTAGVIGVIDRPYRADPLGESRVGAGVGDRDDGQGDLAPVPGASFREVPVSAITPNPKQPRTVFDEDALDELSTSIEAVGVLQPVVVRPLAPGRYELVMGERRWRACQALGRPTVPAIVRDTTDDALLRDALLENIHRTNLNPLEEAAAYQQLLAEFGVTHEELSRRIGRSRPQISNTIRLLNLPPAVQRRVAAGVLSAGHARALLAVDDADDQEALATRIVAEGLSVRAVEEIVALGGAGDRPARKAGPRRPVAASPGLEELADRLADRFDTRVRVDLGRRKGRITIEFATVDDLERIALAMGVRAATPGTLPGGVPDGESSVEDR